MLSISFSSSSTSFLSLIKATSSWCFLCRPSNSSFWPTLVSPSCLRRALRSASPCCSSSRNSSSNLESRYFFSEFSSWPIDLATIFEQLRFSSAETFAEERLSS